jgi:C-terminal processing protease CtpA/Prc
VFLTVLIAFVLLSFPLPNASAPREFDLWRDVLRRVKSELKQDYYDPNFHGMDVEARFREAEEKMKSAESEAHLAGIVAQVLLDLNDTHTFFVPPFNLKRFRYGWRIQPVGADCYVGAVRPGSDAEDQGLRVGDKVLSIDGRPLDRTKVWLAYYYYYTLQPQPGMELLVEKLDKKQEEIIVRATGVSESRVFSSRHFLDFEIHAEAEDRLRRHRFHEPNDEVLIWKMPRFDLDDGELADKFGKVKNRKALILDLRGNEGGHVSSLERFAGYFFDSNIKIAERRGRKEIQPHFARSQKDKVFKGQLVVLIDGLSSSAAEIFARVVQLEKRGLVIGDRSFGSVRQSRYFRRVEGAVEAVGFGVSVTNADVIMSDGKSLENVGVTPDELILPTAQDMRGGLDPVLAHAASLVGVKLDPKKAGELFPVEWKQ